MISLPSSTFGQTLNFQNNFINLNLTESKIQIDHQCHFPFNPSNILSLFLFFEKGIKYIKSGEKRCAWHFVKKLEVKVQSSAFLPNYLQKNFLKKIKEAKNRFDNI